MRVSLNYQDNDLTLNENGSIDIVQGDERVRQKLIQRLHFFKGEWFLDINLGVPYKQEILVAPARVGMAASIFNTEILKEDEVNRIGSVDAFFEADKRKLNYRVTVQTDHGETEVSL